LQVISEIIESCRAHDYTDVILVHEHRGVPDGLVICHLPFGPTAYFELLNVVSSLVILTFFGSIHWLMFWGILYAD
jgi:rRNA maturation protein Rpf1